MDLIEWSYALLMTSAQCVKVFVSVSTGYTVTEACSA